jgi:hypothetical protein
VGESFSSRYGSGWLCRRPVLSLDLFIGAVAWYNASIRPSLPGGVPGDLIGLGPTRRDLYGLSVGDSLPTRPLAGPACSSDKRNRRLKGHGSRLTAHGF